MDSNTIKVLLAACLIASAGANADYESQPGNGGIRGGYYASEELGWTMPIPEGWEVMGTDRVETLASGGEERLTETLGADIDTEGLLNLLNLQKEEPNAFQSTAQPFIESYDGEWREANAELREVLAETYVNAGLGVEVSQTSLVEVGGVEFEFFEMRIFAPDGTELLRQAMFWSLINGYDFGATVSYNDPEIGAEMLDAWRASRFANRQ